MGRTVTHLTVVCASRKKTFYIAASVRNIDNRKLLQSYAELKIYFLKNFAIDQDIAQFDAANERYVMPVNIIPQQYADDLVAKPCKAVDLNDDGTLKDVSIEEVDPSIYHSFRHYGEQNLRA